MFLTKLSIPMSKLSILLVLFSIHLILLSMPLLGRHVNFVMFNDINTFRKPCNFTLRKEPYFLIAVFWVIITEGAMIRLLCFFSGTMAVSL